MEEYRNLHREVTFLTEGDATYHALLSGIAQGDRRVYSAFKRANVSEGEGIECLEFLRSSKIIFSEKSRAMPDIDRDNRHMVSSKLHFSLPFLRFWFAFVSPFFKGIKSGDFSEVEKEFVNRKQEFINVVFEQLCQEYLKLIFAEDELSECAAYWDGDIELSILAETKSGKTIVGECKYTNAKLKKSELTRLEEKCYTAGLEPDIVYIFSKKGFSSELKALKNENLRFASAKNLKKLYM